MASNVSSLLLLLVATTALLLASGGTNFVTAEKTHEVSSVHGGEDEYDLGSGMERRVLKEAGVRFLSYDMLIKNRTPCNNTGTSYYDCDTEGEANPYRRSCNTITRCARE